MLRVRSPSVPAHAYYSAMGRSRGVPGRVRRTALDAVEREAAAVCRSEQRVCRALARGVDPSMEPAAYSVLCAVRALGPSRVTDLAATLGMGTPAVSGHVAALQRLGLIERGEAMGDERSRPVSLTQEGRRRVDRARQERQRHFRAQLEGWDSADVVGLVGLLSRLNAAYLTAAVPDAPLPAADAREGYGRLSGVDER